MRKFIQVTGPIPAGCADPAAYVVSEVAGVAAEVEAIVRADRRWRIVPGVEGVAGIEVTVDPDAWCYRIRVSLDDESGSVPILPGDEAK